MEDSKGITYIRMMLDVLVKKEVYLSKLLEFTTEQEHLLKSDKFDENAFMKLVEQKEDVLGRIEEFDQGFQSIYQRVGETLKDNKEQYKEQILQMQSLIAKLTDVGVKISVLEQKNKGLLQQRLQEKKKGIRQFKVGKKTADTYYKNMIKMQTGTSYFFDKEK